MRKALVCLVAGLLVIGLLAGCGVFPVPNTEAAVFWEDPYVGFADRESENFSLEAFTRVDCGVFDAYVSDYAAYSSDVYFQTLADADRQIYRMFQYAMDHALPCVLIDDRLLEQMECSVEEVLQFFSLDSAVVDQNLVYSSTTYTITTTYDHLFSPGRVEEHSVRQIYIRNFNAENQQKMKQAIQKAQQILDQMPQSLPDREKAAYFYRYLGQNVEYFIPDRSDETRDYLYDALCVGKTNCDGYANAFSLLCSLSGIPCVEKLYIPQGDETGHTWNAIELDGKWYNVDATASDEVLEEPVILSRFGFSDALQEYICAYTDRLPSCSEMLIPPDCTVTDIDSADMQIRQAFSNTDKEYVLALFPGGIIDQDTLQSIADTLNAGITTRHYTVTDGTAVYYIYKTK